jgi:hypothetical protein
LLVDLDQLDAALKIWSLYDHAVLGFQSSFIEPLLSQASNKSEDTGALQTETFATVDEAFFGGSLSLMATNAIESFYSSSGLNSALRRGSAVKLINF